jgi:hypothetical protein
LADHAFGRHRTKQRSVVKTGLLCAYAPSTLRRPGAPRHTGALVSRAPAAWGSVQTVKPRHVGLLAIDAMPDYHFRGGGDQVGDAGSDGLRNRGWPSLTICSEPRSGSLRPQGNGTGRPHGCEGSVQSAQRQFTHLQTGPRTLSTAMFLEKKEKLAATRKRLTPQCSGSKKNCFGLCSWERSLACPLGRWSEFRPRAEVLHGTASRERLIDPSDSPRLRARLMWTTLLIPQRGSQSKRSEAGP